MMNSDYPPPMVEGGYSDPYYSAAGASYHFQHQQHQYPHYDRQLSESSDGGFIYAPALHQHQQHQQQHLQRGSSSLTPSSPATDAYSGVTGNTGGIGDPYGGSGAAAIGYANASSSSGHMNGVGIGGAAAGSAEGGPMAAAGETVSGGSGGSGGSVLMMGGEGDSGAEVDFDDPRIAELPRILLMGPRRGGKTSIQRVVFHKMSPHETLFRLEATQNLERFVVDHTPLCRFAIWDFPGDYYGPGPAHNAALASGFGSDAAAAAGYYGAGTAAAVEVGGQAIGPDGRPMNYPQQHHHHHSQRGVGGASHVDPAVGHGAEPSPSSSPQQNRDGTADDGEGEAAAADDGDAYVFGRATALIFVIDAQDEPYDHVLQSFTETVTRAIRANPHIAIEVFINKVDGELFLSDEAKYDCRRDVMQQVSDELADAGVPPDSVPISYHLTSIYDHSVFEAFSRVVQKLIPQLPTLENLLNVLVSTCSMEKAYLFDVASKLYISTDSSPVDMQSVELCSDMIDVVLDVSGIYGLGGKDAAAAAAPSKPSDGTAAEVMSLSTHVYESHGVAGDLASLSSDLVAKGGDVKAAGADDADANNTAGAAPEQHSFDAAAQQQHQDGGVDPQDELVGTLISQGVAGAEDDGEKEKEVDADSAYDSESASVIRLSNGMVLYLKEVDTMLALVCLTRSENFRKKSLINYNIACLKKALRALVQPTSETADL